MVSRLTGGLKALAKQRKVEIVAGYGKFTGPNEIAVEPTAKQRLWVLTIVLSPLALLGEFAVYSEDERIFDSTGALTLNIPKKMLVLGGGIIGLEMATVAP